MFNTFSQVFVDVAIHTRNHAHKITKFPKSTACNCEQWHHVPWSMLSAACTYIKLKTPPCWWEPSAHLLGLL